MTRQTAPRRSDGQRNRERLLAAASDVVARQGAEASLEQIARQAGLGSATLHRHFPSRYTLLDAVFQSGVQQLRDRAQELLGNDDANGLVVWLEEVISYTACTRGLAESLRSRTGPDDHDSTSCHEILRDAAVSLTARAIETGALRSDVSADDLLVLANGISIATEGDPAAARRLLDLAVQGFQPTAGGPGGSHSHGAAAKI
jgi:AcrR family transcriptional regulator